MSLSAYIVGSIDTWHNGLGYANVQTQKIIKHLGLIPKYQKKILKNMKFV